MLPVTGSFEHRALGRVTFGARDAEVAAVRQSGWPPWVEEQLNPPPGDEARIDEHLRARSLHIAYAVQLPAGKSPGWPAVDERRPLRYLHTDLAAIWEMVSKTEISIAPNERHRIQQELNAATWIRNAHSRYQLREFMADFWANHFNVGRNEDIYGAAALVHYDSEVIRPNAFGNFRKFLEAVATSPAMLRYLNNAESKASKPTETYVRELLELHTLGEAAYAGLGTNILLPKWQSGPFMVATHFTDQDIVAAARAFSGWTLEHGQDGPNGPLPFTGKFIYNPLQHNNEAGVFMGVDVSGHAAFQAPMGQGRMILDILAAHPMTARFIVGKICRRIFGDSPPQNVVERAIGTWLANIYSPDQIKHVLREILLRPEMGDPPSKLRRPYERLMALFRTTDTILNAYDDAYTALFGLGDGLYAWPTPDGRPDTDAYWLSSAGNHHFWNLMFDVLVHPSFRTSFADQTPASVTGSAAQIVEYWVGRMVGYTLPQASMDALIKDVNTSPGVMAAYASQGILNIENALRRLALLIATSPQFAMR
jgi:uncharacterized protein (DUF1800 family)